MFGDKWKIFIDLVQVFGIQKGSMNQHHIVQQLGFWKADAKMQVFIRKRSEYQKQLWEYIKVRQAKTGAQQAVRASVVKDMGLVMSWTQKNFAKNKLKHRCLKSVQVVVVVVEEEEDMPAEKFGVRALGQLGYSAPEEERVKGCSQLQQPRALTT